MNARDFWQFTPLHEAVAKQRLEVCSLLLAHGADPDSVNCYGKSVYDVCPTSSSGGDDDCRLVERIRREHRGHALFEAIVNATEIGHKLKKCITLETVNFKHPFTGDSPLHVAVALATSFHHKPSSTSASAGSASTVPSMPAMSNGTSGVSHQSPASSSAMTPKLRKQIVELLIRKGASVNASNANHLTPLHVASEAGHVDLIELLLKYNAKMNVLDSTRQSPLHRAVLANQQNSCQVLLSYGVDITLVNHQGHTAEQIAANNGNESLQTLIANHRLTSKENAELDLLEASKAGDLKVVRTILARHPQLVNCQDVDGRQSTPLHFASGYNRIDVVEYLLECGADVGAKDKGGLGTVLCLSLCALYLRFATYSSAAQCVQLRSL